MKKLLTITCLLLVCMCVAQVPDSLLPRDPWKNTRAGNDLYKNKDYAGAEKKYREALQTDTANAVVHSNLGNSLYKQGKYDEATAAYDDAARMSSGDTAAKAYYNKGNALFKQNDLEGSQEAYKEALKRNPDDQNARHNLAMTQKLVRARKKDGWKDTLMSTKKDPKGKYLAPDSAGKKELQKEDKKPGDKDPKKKEPFDPKKQSMSPEEAKKVMEALKNEEQQTRQRLNKGNGGSDYHRSKDKDW